VKFNDYIGSARHGHSNFRSLRMTDIRAFFSGCLTTNRLIGYIGIR
jgi:hypothetical protein